MDTDLLAMIEDCEARESRLTEWEAGFIDSVRNRLESGNSLSARQVDKLNDIWERATEKG